MSDKDQMEPIKEAKAKYDERVAKLETWMRRGRMVLPLLQKVLGQ